MSCCNNGYNQVLKEHPFKYSIPPAYTLNTLPQVPQYSQQQQHQQQQQQQQQQPQYVHVPYYYVSEEQYNNCKKEKKEK